MSDLLDAFQGATALSVELKMTPRWRRRKRQRLQARLDAVCRRADRERDRLGAEADAPRLADVIRTAGVGRVSEDLRVSDHLLAHLLDEIQQCQIADNPPLHIRVTARAIAHSAVTLPITPETADRLGCSHHRYGGRECVEIVMHPDDWATLADRMAAEVEANRRADRRPFLTSAQTEVPTTVWGLDVVEDTE